MAFSKTVTLGNGTVVAYWSIISMQAVLLPVQALNVYLGGFVSEAYAATGNPLVTRCFQFSAADLGVEDMSTVTQAQAYTAILARVNDATTADPLVDSTQAGV